MVNVGPTVLERISRYNEGELLFNLLAIVPERSAPDKSFGEIARQRKVDFEKVIYRALDSIGRQGISRAMIGKE